MRELEERPVSEIWLPCFTKSVKPREARWLSQDDRDFMLHKQEASGSSVFCSGRKGTITVSSPCNDGGANPLPRHLIKEMLDILLLPPPPHKQTDAYYIRKKQSMDINSALPDTQTGRKGRMLPPISAVCCPFQQPVDWKLSPCRSCRLSHKTIIKHFWVAIMCQNMC